jgi:hypothetical protein
VLGQAETLFDHASQAIPSHCVSRGFHRDGKAHAGMRESIGLDAKSEESIVDAPATRVNRVELQLAAQT